METLMLLFIAAFSFVTSMLVDYSDLEVLNVSCRNRDTCSTNTSSTFFTRNCECDSLCHSFGDCCVDAPTAITQNSVHEQMGLSCIPINPYQGVYAIGKCKSSWNGSDEVRTKCENQGNFSDPLVSLPSTDTDNNVTYRNHYCAECNYASLNNISLWTVSLTCDSLTDIDNITRDFILENVAQLGSYWGVYHWNESEGDMEFYPCEVSFHFPDYLRSHVRYCRPYIISTCTDNWKLDIVRSYCLAYMSVIYIGEQAYRNAHCALCNSVSVRNRTCIPLETTRRTNPSMSFTILLDINQSDGDQVGETKSCPSGEKYDPFFKKCRVLSCALPGQVLRKGRCVRQ